MELVTGRKGEAHVTSQQDRMLHQGVFGTEAYILNTGKKLKPEVQSSNEIRIRDGALMVQGALSCVKINTYDSITIQNGTQGMKRIDLIVWQYMYNAESDTEYSEWNVIQGMPDENEPHVPEYVQGDIQIGDNFVQVPYLAVHLDGINITEVEMLLEVIPDIYTTNKSLTESITELNRKLVQTETGKFILPNGLKIFWGKGKTSNTTDPAAVYSAYVIFPETFSNGDYFFTCTEFIGTGEAQKWDKVFNYYSHSNSGTYVGCTYPGKTFYWLAIGY